MEKKMFFQFKKNYVFRKLDRRETEIGKTLN